MSSKKIIILDGNSRQALTVVRALGSAGYKVIVGASNRNALAFYSRFVSERFIYTPPEKSPDKFINEITRLSKDRKAKVILPILEPTILELSRVRDELESKSIMVPVADTESLTIAMDKYSVYKLARELRIPTPKSILVHDINELIDIPSQLNFPLVLKIPKEAGIPPRNRFTIVKDLDELKQKFRYFLKFSDNLIIQEYISGFGVGSFYLFNKFKSLITYFGHVRVFENPFSGVSIICEDFFSSELFSQGLKLLDRLKWKGVAMVEFRLEKQSGVPYLLEVNPRFWGSLPLAIKAGFNFPRLLIETWTKDYTSSTSRDISFDNIYNNSSKTRYLILSPAIELIAERITKKQIRNLLEDISLVTREFVKNIKSTFEIEHFDIKPFLMRFRALI